jgi:hypothetical protein
VKYLKCHRENPEGVTFFGACGRSLPKLIRSKRGNINAPGIHFFHKYSQPLAAIQATSATSTTPPVQPQQTSFANDRYQVNRFMGEGVKAGLPGLWRSLPCILENIQ